MAADAVVPLSQCRTDQREREMLQFMWMGGTSLHYTGGETETPVRECMRDAIVSVERAGTALGIVRFTVTLEPR